MLDNNLSSIKFRRMVLVVVKVKWQGIIVF